MPYSKLSEVPKNIRKLDNVKLSLSQANVISRVADAIDEDDVDSPFAVAIANFKSSHTVKNGKWKKRGNKDNKSLAYVEKQGDGRYKIVAVSTVALKDREGDTFTTEAMDFDIALAEKTNLYPEFRVFHHVGLGIGKVTKMSRVGMFAIDSGYSYDDPFSIAVMEKMLSNNDGKWRVSRGFRTLEVAGGCPDCGEAIQITMKHMVVGFRCPNCDSVHATYKGILDDVQFKKTRTFDVTVTDTPSVPWTGVSAYSDILEDTMTKKQLKKKLLAEGIDEKVIDERLKQLTSEELKAYDDIPDATLLKEFDFEEEDEEDEEDNPSSKKKKKSKKKAKKEYHGDEQVFTLDEDVLVTFKEIVVEAVTELLDEALDNLEIESPDVNIDDLDIEIKEIPAIVELKELVEDVAEKVDALMQSDEERLKELLGDLPRNSATMLRIRKKQEDSDDDDDGSSDNGYIKKALGQQEVKDVYSGGDEEEPENMTEWLTQPNKSE